MIEELKMFVLSTLHFVYCDLCFYVIINPRVTSLYILCNGNTSCVGALHDALACVILVIFFHYANGFDHVVDWVNVCFV
jgi:hypothetical protein